MSASSSATDLLKTPLHDLHLELGARMVPFAGYSMPVQYPAGLMAEHLHCRASATLFDVSHMGQLRLTGDDIFAALESLLPIDVAGLADGQQRYGFLTDEQGGILDDLMLTRHRVGRHHRVAADRQCGQQGCRHRTAALAHRRSLHGAATPRSGTARAAGPAGGERARAV